MGRPRKTKEAGKGSRQKSASKETIERFLADDANWSPGMAMCREQVERLHRLLRRHAKDKVTGTEITPKGLLRWHVGRRILDVQLHARGIWIAVQHPPWMRQVRVRGNAPPRMTPFNPILGKPPHRADDDWNRFPWLADKSNEPVIRFLQSIDVLKPSPPLLKAMALSNFKAIGEQVQISFSPITLLFGANSSGKSSIINALHYAAEIFERHNLDPDRLSKAGDWVELGGFSQFVHRYKLGRTIGMGFELDLRQGMELPSFPFLDERSCGIKPLNIESARVGIEIRRSKGDNAPFVAKYRPR